MLRATLMLHPPELIPLSFLKKTMGSPVVLIVGVSFVLWLLYRFVFRMLGKLATLLALMLLVVAAYVTLHVHKALARWQKSVLSPAKPSHAVTSGHATTGANGLINPLSSGGQSTALQGVNLDAMSPLIHQNAWVIAAAVVIAALGIIGYLIYRAMSPTARINFVQLIRSSRGLDSFKHRSDDRGFPINEIELAIQKDNGRRITIRGKDRFLNTAVLGSIGTGKTSRILLKAIVQDLRAIASGWFMDVIVADPDGEFAQKVVRLATRLGIENIDIIDLRTEDDEKEDAVDDSEEVDFLESTVSFNPFAGGNIADIIDNVRAALQEKMGRQDGYFQNAQDNLVRVVIQVQVPLWPETDFLNFADLVTDPIHFRGICNMVNEHATLMKPTTTAAPKGKKKDEGMNDISVMWEHERSEVIARYDALGKNEKSMVLAAARSFLMDTRSEQKMEKLETVTNGLKIVVGELAYNPRLRKVFGTDALPAFDLKSFLNTKKDKRGRLMVVITGNQPAGKLFGKLFLVTLKMYTLRRRGTEDTRRPVYLYADEFAVFGTESFTEMFSQARKYRVGMMLAWQARAQLLDVSKKFQDVVEGSCRNKVFFPSPSPDDAKFLEHALGTTTNLKVTHSQNKLNWLFFDNRNLDPKVSTTETIDPRFRIEDISYGLRQDEAIFVITEDNQAMPPVVGLTSYAQVWMNKQRGFFKVERADRGSTNQKPRFEWRRMITRKTRKGRVKPVQNESSQESMANIAAPVLESSVTAVEEARLTRQGTYVRPTANPDTVISIEDFLHRRDAVDLHSDVTPVRDEPMTSQVLTEEYMPSLDTTLETVQQSEEESAPAATNEIVADPSTDDIKTEDAPVAKRIDLRKRTSTPTETSKQGKPCPNCLTVNLELTSDERKWRCPVCEFERKNRSSGQFDS